MQPLTFSQSSGITIYRKYILNFLVFFQLLGSTFFCTKQNKQRISSCQQPEWSCCFPAGPKAVTGTTAPSPPGAFSNRAGRCFWRLLRNSLPQHVHGMHSVCLFWSGTALWKQLFLRGLHLEFETPKHPEVPPVRIYRHNSCCRRRARFSFQNYLMLRQRTAKKPLKPTLQGEVTCFSQCWEEPQERLCAGSPYLAPAKVVSDGAARRQELLLQAPGLLLHVPGLGRGGAVNGELQTQARLRAGQSSAPSSCCIPRAFSQACKPSAFPSRQTKPLRVGLWTFRVPNWLHSSGTSIFRH